MNVTTESVKREGKVKLELPDISRRLKTALLDLSFDVVIGIATGGTVLAALAAYELELPLKLMHLNYRAEDNTPRYEAPKLQAAFTLTGRHRILIVDDVSVTGATFRAAKTLLKNHEVTTLALKGQADTVLYPEVTRCILLPWRD